jgi:hypothetical protein
MDVIARRAFERPDVEANRAGGNPRQLGTRLAYGAEWSLDDHDASPSHSGGSVTELSVTDRPRGAVMGLAWSLRDPRRWSKLLTFEKLTQL